MPLRVFVGFYFLFFEFLYALLNTFTELAQFLWVFYTSEGSPPKKNFVGIVVFRHKREKKR